MIAVTFEFPRRPAGKVEGDSSGAAEESELWFRLFGDLSNGKAGAVEALYDACSRQVFGLAFWRTGSVEDANDIVQETFVRLVERREALRGVKKPRSWLLSLAHHVAVDVTRRRKHTATQPIEALPFLSALETDPEREIDAANASRCLVTLPASQRDAIYLRHFADCTFQAIGRITGVPTFTAASRYRLGMAKLRSLMGETR